MTDFPLLTEILDLVDLEPNLFEAPPVMDGRPRVFGGQIAAQALAAASFTVEEGWACHSFHGRFLLPGKPGRPIQLEVTPLRDGRRFAARQVIAIQRHEPIFVLTASFQGTPGEGVSHRALMPDVPQPEELPDERTQTAATQSLLQRAGIDLGDFVMPIEVLRVDGQTWLSDDAHPNACYAWFRSRHPLPDATNFHRCVVTYGTDMFAVPTCARPLPVALFDPEFERASLDHSLWFHRPFRADQWLLYAGQCDVVDEGRGLARGQVFTRDGQLVATLMQEALLQQRS